MGVCRVHFLRNVLAKVPKAEADMVVAYVRTVFARPTPVPFATSSTLSPTPWP